MYFKQYYWLELANKTNENTGPKEKYHSKYMKMHLP